MSEPAPHELAPAEPDPPWNPVRKRELGLVAAIALAVLLPGLASYSLIDPWEGHYGEVARRMLEDDDWTRMQWQNEAYFRSKPVLTFWLMAASMSLHGVATDGGYSGEMIASDWPTWALRFPFALFGAFGLIMLWWMLARLASRRVAWIGFGVCATMPFYTLVSRQAITDIPMVTTAMGAIACFLLAIHAGERELRPLWKRFTAYHVFLAALGLFVGLQLLRFAIDFTADPSLGRGVKVPWFHPAVWTTVPFLLGFAALVGLTWFVFRARTTRQVYMYWAYFLVGVSVLAKGPPGAAVVVVVCALYVAVTGSWRFLLRASIPEGIVIILLAAAPWHVAQFLKDGRPWASEYFGHHWFKRAGKGVHQVLAADEQGTFNFYARQLGAGLWPWIALVPAALYAGIARGAARLREDRVRLAMVLWAVGGFAFFSMVETKFHHYVLPAVPAFAALIAFWADDILRGRAGLGVALVVALPILWLVALDMKSEQKQLIELFIYRYDRPWPAGAPWNVDLGGVFFGFAVVATVALGAVLDARIRRWAMIGFGAVVAVYGYWVMNGYMRAAAPHWGQRALHETYYAKRQIHGLDILYYGLRDLADEWSGGARELRVESVLPEGFAAGQPAKVHIEVQNQDSYDLAGTVSRTGDDEFWISVPEAEVAKLADPIARGRTMKPSGRRAWTQVNADRLIAWQLNWRGENFWEAGDVWGRTKDTQTVYDKTDNKAFLEYIKRPEAQNRRFFVITEAGRADGLKNILPTTRGKQTVEKIDTSCNKFTLLRFDL